MPDKLWVWSKKVSRKKNTKKSDWTDFWPSTQDVFHYHGETILLISGILHLSIHWFALLVSSSLLKQKYKSSVLLLSVCSTSLYPCTTQYLYSSTFLSHNVCFQADVLYLYLFSRYIKRKLKADVYSKIMQDRLSTWTLPAFRNPTVRYSFSLMYKNADMQT